MDKDTVTAPNSAPKEGCLCDVCRFFYAQRRLDADLEANYEKYLAGELVSRDGKE